MATVRRVRLDALTDPMTLDEFAAESGMPARMLSAALDELDAAGWVEPASGGRYWLTVPVDDPRGRP